MQLVAGSSAQGEVAPSYSPVAQQAYESIDRGTSGSRSRPGPSDTMPICLALAFFPSFVMAKAASPRRSGWLRVLVFAVVTILYTGGIVCFTLSSTLHDSVFITNTGKPIKDSAAVFFVAWALYAASPFMTVAVDLGVWLRWGLATGLDDVSDREYNVNYTSVILIVVHLLCQLLLTVAMLIQSCQVEAASWDPTCLGSCCCGCYCPHWWLGKALAAERKDQLNADEIPAYDA